MAQQITIAPTELMDTALLLATSAVELADIGSTLRSCTVCAMPAEVRTSVDAVVATADRVLDDMAAGLRAEAGELARRAVIAANDMLSAAGLPLIPGTNITSATAVSPSPTPYVHSGVIWNPPSESSGYGGTMALAAAAQKSQERSAAAFSRLSASGASFTSGSFPMPGALSLTSLPTPYNPWLGMSMSDITNKVGGTPTPSEIKFNNPALAAARDRGIA